MNIIKKNFGELITLIILTLSFLIIYYSCTNNGNFDIEHFTQKSNGTTTWNRNKCKYTLGDTLENELKKHGIKKSSNSWNLYFPCGYDEIQKEISQMPIVKNGKYFIIDSCDEMVAKEWLWINIKNHYGLNYAKILLPNSFVLYDPVDLERFEKEYDNKKIYIMKKNIQRQEGLKITNNKSEIVNGFKNKYALLCSCDV